MDTKELVIALSLVLGCGPGATEAVDRDVVYVDNAWTIGESGAIVDAVAAWGPPLRPVLAACDGAHFCIVPDDDPTPLSGPDVVGETFCGAPTAYVFRSRLYAVGRPDYLQQTASHELGHLLGCPLGHRNHLPPGNVMAADSPDQVPIPTTSDRAYVGY